MNTQESQAHLLGKEVERLQMLVEQLQTEREKDRQILKSLQEERKEFMRYLCARAKEQYSMEQLEQWATEEPEDAVPLNEFIDELERIADEHAPGK